MPTALKVALFGAVLSIVSMIVIILTGLHVITISNITANYLGVSTITGLIIMIIGLMKGLPPY